MLLKVFKSKIHRATVTKADLHYEGSISIDKTLIDAADLHKYEAVWVWNINNGERLMTYVIEGERDSGVICLNGSAARLCQPGDLVIITSFVDITPEELETFRPTVVLVNNKNEVSRVLHESGHEPELEVQCLMIRLKENYSDKIFHIANELKEEGFKIDDIRFQSATIFAKTDSEKAIDKLKELTYINRVDKVKLHK